jgi:hypothetical protein
MAIAGKIIIGDEEPPVALTVVCADSALEIVGRAKPALSALDIDDRTERALVGASATEIEARQLPGNSTDMLARQDRRRLSLQ